MAHTCLGRYWWGRWTAAQGSGSHKWGSKGINLLTFHELLKPYNLGLVQFDCLVYRIYYFISERFCIQRIKNIFMISCQTLMYFEYHEKIWPLRSLAFGEKSAQSVSPQHSCCPVHLLFVSLPHALFCGQCVMAWVSDLTPHRLWRKGGEISLFYSSSLSSSPLNNSVPSQ